MTQLNYEYDGQWDWKLKKEGREDVLKALRNQEAMATGGQQE